MKWDGIRALVSYDEGKIRIRTRNQNDVTAQFPELLDGEKAFRATNAVFDAEIVSLDTSGKPVFKKVINRLMSSGDDRNVFPTRASILISGSKELFRDCNNSSNPLNTERTIINAAVLKATPPIARIPMILMKFAFRLETRYRLAMKKGKFNVLGF